jgi:predicted Fe-Mo cluster-binding NifX family protein
MMNISAHQRIGVITAKNLERKNIRTVLTGSCGPNAFEELQAAGIEVVLNAQGIIRQALARYQNGELSRASTPNVAVSF